MVKITTSEQPDSWQTDSMFYLARHCRDFYINLHFGFPGWGFPAGSLGLFYMAQWAHFTSNRWGFWQEKSSWKSIWADNSWFAQTGYERIFDFSKLDSHWSYTLASERVKVDQKKIKKKIIKHGQYSMIFACILFSLQECEADSFGSLTFWTTVRAYKEAHMFAPHSHPNTSEQFTAHIRGHVLWWQHRTESGEWAVFPWSLRMISDKKKRDDDSLLSPVTEGLSRQIRFNFLGSYPSMDISLKEKKNLIFTS